MADGRSWLALVTFERRSEDQAILPDWAHGACGWMVARAPDQATARKFLVRDVESCGLRVLKIDKMQEIFANQDVEAIDNCLATNLSRIEPGKETVWGIIHGYKGEGQA